MQNTHISADIAGKSLPYLTVKSNVPKDEYILSDPLQPLVSTSPKNQNTVEVTEWTPKLEVKCEDDVDDKNVLRNLVQYVKPESNDLASYSSQLIKQEEPESKYVYSKEELERFTSDLQNDEQQSWNHNETKLFSTCTKIEENFCNIGLQDNVFNNNLALEKLSQTGAVEENEEILPDIPSTLFQALKKADVSLQLQDTLVFSSTLENCMKKNSLHNFTSEPRHKSTRNKISRKRRTKKIKKESLCSMFKYTVPTHNPFNTQHNIPNLQSSRRIEWIESKRARQEIKIAPKSNEGHLKTTFSEVRNPELGAQQVTNLDGSSSDDDGGNSLTDENTISDEISTIESRNSKKIQSKHQDVSSHSREPSTMENSGTHDIFHKPVEIKGKKRLLRLKRPESSFQRSSTIVHNSGSFNSNHKHNQTTKGTIQQKSHFPHQQIQDFQNIAAFCQEAERGVDELNNKRSKRVKPDFHQNNSSNQCKTKTVQISLNSNKKCSKSVQNQLLNRSSYTARLKRLNSETRNNEYQAIKVLQMPPIGNLLNNTGSSKNLHSQSSADSNSHTSKKHIQRNASILVQNKNVNALNSAEKSIVRDKYKLNPLNLSKPLISVEKPLKKLGESPENTVGNSSPHEDDSTVTTNHRNSHENSEPSMAGIINQCDYEVTALTNSNQTKEKENLITAEKIAITPKLNKKKFNEPSIAKTSVDSGIVVIGVDAVSTTQTNNTQLSKCEEKKEESPRKVGKHLCHKCNKYYATPRTLACHLETHSDLDKYVCVQCCKAYHSRTGFDFHMRNVHSSESHKCSQCEKTYKSSGALRNHTSRFHSNKKLNKKSEVCDVCRKIYSDKKTLSRHRKNKHETAVRLFCNDCSASFFNKSELLSHIKARHMAPSIKCTICSEMFGTYGKLYTHLRKNHLIDKRPEYICHVCGKSTRGKDALESHSLIHTNEKPFVCEDCGKCFRTAGNLLQHSRSHKDIRRFSCGLCDSSFRLRHHLRQHMSVHGMVSTSKYRNKRRKRSSSSSDSL